MVVDDRRLIAPRRIALAGKAGQLQCALDLVGFEQAQHSVYVDLVAACHWVSSHRLRAPIERCRDVSLGQRRPGEGGEGAGGQVVVLCSVGAIDDIEGESLRLVHLSRAEERLCEVGVDEQPEGVVERHRLQEGLQLDPHLRRPADAVEGEDKFLHESGL